MRSLLEFLPDAPGDLELEPNGMSRLRDWERRCAGLVVPGEKGERPGSVTIIREAMEVAVEHAGARLAYDAWIADLLDDDGFADADDSTLWGRFETHDLAVGMIAEGRWYGSLFLGESTADHFRVAPQLLRADGCAERRKRW